LKKRNVAGNAGNNNRKKTQDMGPKRTLTHKGRGEPTFTVYGYTLRKRTNEEKDVGTKENGTRKKQQVVYVFHISDSRGKGGGETTLVKPKISKRDGTETRAEHA